MHTSMVNRCHISNLQTGHVRLALLSDQHMKYGVRLAAQEVTRVEIQEIIRRWQSGELVPDSLLSMASSSHEPSQKSSSALV